MALFNPAVANPGRLGRPSLPHAFPQLPRNTSTLSCSCAGCVYWACGVERERSQESLSMLSTNMSPQRFFNV